MVSAFGYGPFYGQETCKMSELQKVYEDILEIKFDRRNFYKKMNKLGGSMVLKGAQDCIKEIFEVTGFGGILTFED